MTTVGDTEAATHFTRLLERVAGGESIVITRGGQEVAVMIPARGATGAHVPADAIAQWRSAREGLSLGVLLWPGLSLIHI